MEVKRIKSKFLKGIMDQNSYLVLGEKSAVLIDAGAEVEDVKYLLGERKLEAILVTHLHFDHFWNLEKIVQVFDAKVFIMHGTDKKFNDENQNGSVLIRRKIELKLDAKNIAYYECDGQKLNFDDIEFTVMFTPGHSSDSVCLLSQDCLFSGDTVFNMGVGRTDLIDSSLDNQKKSLQKIKETNYNVCYPGHGESGTKQEIDEVIKYCL